MGLMQIMPKTWAELRARHGLGADANDVRDNNLAGTAYIRELFDRYGALNNDAAMFVAKYTDAAAVVEHLDLRDAVHIGHSSPLGGGREITVHPDSRRSVISRNEGIVGRHPPMSCDLFTEDRGGYFEDVN